MNITTVIFFFLSSIVGYGAAKFFAGPRAGVEGRVRSWIFRIHGYYVHIHHWMWGSAALGLLLLMHFQNVFVYGLLTGITIQGLNYRNRFTIIYKM